MYGQNYEVILRSMYTVRSYYKKIIDFLYIDQILCNGFGFSEVIDKSMSVDYTKFL